MTWVAVGSAAVTVVGGAVSGKQSSDAAARNARNAAPYSVGGQFGSLTYGPDHKANLALDPQSQAFADMAQKFGASQFGHVTDNPMDALTPDQIGAYGSALGLNTQLGMNANTNANNLFASLQSLGNDPTAIGNNYYHMLAAQAAPGQSQAFNSLQQKLFSQGRLGTSGGGTEFKGFFDSANQADIGRQIQGANFGQQWQQQLQSEYGDAANQAQNTAANRFQMATGLLQTGMNQNSAYMQQATGAQSLYSNIFQPLMQAGGFGQNGNQVGAQMQNNADQSRIDAYSSAFGQLAPLVGQAIGSRGNGLSQADNLSIGSGANNAAYDIPSMPVAPIDGY